MKKIEITNLKNINHCLFEFPEKKGVYLLAGSNGTGKTTLLVCMDRIRDPYAFSTGFLNASTWNKADQYKDAKITYIVDDKSVSFRKKAQRWMPTPKLGSNDFLAKFGYSDAVFIRADSRRIDIKAEDLKEGNLIAADSVVKDCLNELLETRKYDDLMRLKNQNGRGRQATTFFYVIKDKNMYYSEKRFSTGELALVRLVERLETVSPKSLILLDEGELALHPKVQVNLLKYLQKKAEEKDLVVFISTHSPTMLKAVKKEEIYLLREENGKIEIVNPCYPASAIGDVDFATSNIFDYIFFVEDDKAQNILRHMRERYVKIKPEHATALCNIIPVGGFYETSRMAVNTGIRVFGDSKVFAVVDQDAVENIEQKPKFEELFKRHSEIIKTLTFTPEVWLIAKLETADNPLKNKILGKYHIELNTVLQNEKYKKCNSTNPRQLAKDKYRVFIDYLCDVTGISSEILDYEIVQSVIEDIPDGEVLKVLNPLFEYRKK